MLKMNLSDLDAFQLKDSNVTCARYDKFKGGNTWQIMIPYKSQGGCKWKYANSPKEAWEIANKWRKRGY